MWWPLFDLVGRFKQACHLRTSAPTHARAHPWGRRSATRDMIGVNLGRLWLNPPEWVREEADVIPSLPPRLLPVDEHVETELRKRTLTNLYNERPPGSPTSTQHSTPPSSPPTAGRPTSAMTRCWSCCSNSILSGRPRPLPSFVPHRRPLHLTTQRRPASRMPVISETPNYVWVDAASNLASIARVGSSVRLKGCSTRPKISNVTAPSKASSPTSPRMTGV